MKTFGFERKLNLLIGTPEMGVWTSEFGKSLVNMMGYLMATPVPGFREQTMRPMQMHGSILPRSRWKLFQEAIQQGCTYLLFIDSDQEFPRETAHRLLQHRKDVVACNVATKQIPASPTARSKGGIDGVPVYTDPDSPELERVWRVGTGIMLLDVRVCKAVDPRCFEIRWVPQLNDYQGEDWSLCEAIQAAGFDIWIDHRLSDEIGHIGKFNYKHEIVGEKQVMEVDDERRIGEA